MATPTAREQYIVELINRARSDPAAEAARQGIGLNDDLAPGTITTTAKQPVAISPLLVDSANAHSLSMILEDYFSHTGSDGSTPSERIFRAGWEHENLGYSTGENLSFFGSTDTSIANALETLDAQHKGLIESESHREIIMTDRFTEIGVGQQIGEFQGSTVSMITENFADAGRTYLTGVAIDDGDGDDFYDVGEGLEDIQVTATGSTGTFTTTTWSSGGYTLELDAGTYNVTFSGGAFGAGYDAGSITVANQNVKVDANLDEIITSTSTITVAELATGDPAEIFAQLRDYDGNDLGTPEGWKKLGEVDIQNDGDKELIYVNSALGRWATLGPDTNDTIHFDDHGLGGETRVVGVYLDPLVESGLTTRGGPHDSAQRFANDLRIDNLQLLGEGDYDSDGLQQVYFRTVDGTAYLHALMHADGNIQYANYQSQQQMIDYLEGNGFGASTYGDWLVA